MQVNPFESQSLMRVAVVEDEKIIQLEITRTLEQMGYQIAGLATTGPEAIALAESVKPDIMLMDIRLRGDMDGIEAAEQIITQYSLPIIYLTANADEETIQRAKVSSPYGYLIKPVNFRELHTTLQMALYKHRAEQRICASETKYRALFEHSNDGLIIFNAEGAVMDGNTRITTLLNRDMATLQGLDMTSLHHPDCRDDWTQAVKALQREGGMRYETIFLAAEGQSIDVEVSGSFLDEKQSLAMAMVRDVSERRRSDKVIHNISEEIAGYTGPSFFNALVRYLAEALEVDIAFVAELYQDQPKMVKTLAFCDRSIIQDNQIYLLTGSPCQKVLEQDFLLCADSVQSEFPQAELLERLDAQSYAGMVLRGPDRQTIGYLVVMDRKPLRHLSSVKSTLQLFSVRASAEMNRLYHEETIRVSEERYRLLFNNGLDAVLVYGLEGENQPSTLWDVNDVACSLLEYERHELAHLTPQSLLASPKGQSAFTVDGLFEGTLQSKTGRQIPFEISVHRFPIQGQITVLAVARDLTQRKRVEEALAKERELMAKIIEHSPVHIFLKDTQGRYMTVNPAFVQFAGKTQNEEVVGRTAGELFSSEFAQSIETLDQAILTSRKPQFNVETRFGGGQGEERWLLTTKVPLNDPSGRCLGIVGISQDITDRVATEREMQRAMLAAESANKAKSEFLANMSHELRTPMNGIIGLTELAIEGTEDEEIRRYLQMVAQSADSLLAILNDILDFAKIESGKVSLDQRPFEFSPFMGELEDLHGVTAQKKGLTLHVMADADIPAMLIGDSGRLRQVLNNLLGNAIKFTEQGEIAVRVHLLEKLDSNDAIPQSPLYRYLHFEVSDTGIGIREEQIETIFSSFTQADGSLTRSYGGTGLGLAISRQLIETMGGEIWVESRYGEGSRFQFYLPFKPVTRESEERVRASVETSLESASGSLTTPLLRGKRILVVEDEPVSREVVVRFLTKWGGRIITANHGQEALDQLAASAFDMVIMDVQMPVLDGLEATRRIRRGEVPGVDPKIPILALTAHAMERDRRRCLDAGMNDYVVKPIDSQLLWQTLEGQLAGSPSGSASHSDVDGEAGGGLIDEKAVLHRLAGDQELFMKTMHIFHEQIPERIAALTQAVEAHDGEEVAHLAHSLKSASANIGAFGLREQAEILEQEAPKGAWRNVKHSHQNLLDQYQRVMDILPRYFTRETQTAEGSLCQH